MKKINPCYTKHKIICHYVLFTILCYLTFVCGSAITYSITCIANLSKRINKLSKQNKSHFKAKLCYK